jgi:hypothetical protein
MNASPTGLAFLFFALRLLRVTVRSARLTQVASARDSAFTTARTGDRPQPARSAVRASALHAARLHPKRLATRSAPRRRHNDSRRSAPEPSAQRPATQRAPAVPHRDSRRGAPTVPRTESLRGAPPCRATRYAACTGRAAQRLATRREASPFDEASLLAGTAFRIGPPVANLQRSACDGARGAR